MTNRRISRKALLSIALPGLLAVGAFYAFAAWSIAPYANTNAINLRAMGQIAQAPFAERIIIGDSRVALAPPTGEALLIGYGGAPFTQMARLTGVICSVSSAPVVIALGANDALERFDDPDASETAMREMVDDCGAARTTLVGVWPSEPDVPDLGNKFDVETIADLNLRMEAVAAENGATYAPPPDDLTGRTIDGIHFTPETSADYLAALLEYAER